MIFFQNFGYLGTYFYAKGNTQRETGVMTIGKSAKQIFLKMKVTLDEERNEKQPLIFANVLIYGLDEFLEFLLFRNI